MGQEVILIVIVVAFAAFMFYNSRKRKKQQAELATKMVPGAQVMLSFGLYGKLLSVDDEKVTAEVEIAPGTIVTVHRQTLSRVVDDTANDVDTAVTPEDEPKRVTELNGQPVVDDQAPAYGERTDEPNRKNDN
ncbi:preprotein translocase subunit YajC [Curtobacterium luteum]|uniref:Preprotein translocase subunit YajC n=1 Tax=Curtobacterium luteum TaxID=33881 RepID=A0A175RHX2_9MICO|nr:preprotein translocase subunit YajC [Curtobacterium luteum]KTR02893.1 hypothetical protein NS184_14820 [Curtobacterium luteum]